MVMVDLIYFMVCGLPSGHSGSSVQVSSEHRPSSCHLSSVSHARGSLHSCSCVRTCHRWSVTDRLMSYIPIHSWRDLPLSNGRDTRNFCHMPESLRPEASVFTPHRHLQNLFGVHLPLKIPLDPHYHPCSTTSSHKIPTQLLCRLHIAPSLPESNRQR